ncbi:hypothetical protein N7510_008806 [Penicillium lagena]|uniref:uncharacterized protein n=1 Tax=Penicillium lagena TaxID=94218 RepID=UPI00254075C7|nr:uncharacterized protein N7510_008806 [Penicillium lagena]KAJ5606025.1 hypothetical protein N7510_008806 [Penicillium lagena]
MLRALTVVAPSARLLSGPAASIIAASKSAFSAAHVLNNTRTPILRHATILQLSRAFTSTSPTRSPSPFRLASNKKPTPSPTPSAETEPSAEDIYSAYQPKRQWPPDMSKLSQKHQFRLERKYRRRAALKYARPKFIKGVTLAQWVIIGFVAVYAILFMDWDTRETPFDGLRERVFSSIRSVFSSPAPPNPVRRTGENNNSASRSESE